MKELNKILKEKETYLKAKIPKQKRSTRTPNDILIYKKHAEIILRNNKQAINGIILINIKDIELIKNYKWSLSAGYARTTINGETLRMHRLLMNCPKDKVVDHINHNKLDNQRKNLRIITQKENNQNTLPKENPRIFKIKE